MPLAPDTLEGIATTSALTRLIAIPDLSPIEEVRDSAGMLAMHFRNPGEAWMADKPAIDPTYLRFKGLTDPSFFKILASYGALSHAQTLQP